MKVDFETEVRGATAWVEAEMGAPEHDVGIMSWYPHGITVFFVYRPEEVFELTEAEYEVLADEAIDLAESKAASWEEDFA